MNKKVEASIMDALTTVIDPELRVDIVNLGLINAVDINSIGDVTINMTLTTMGCPLISVLEEMIDEALKILPEVKITKVELTWEPAWEIDRMSRYAKMALGL
ncbi:metal-sulfur cluster assembly factor [Leuconostoc mesenteroides]|uniref:metal-sulfur cluster assembly factor n=1 Tax=Leuconostoc mesenteroides TaxID=1245 RepID=UPI00065E93E0|nr:metal-sulfur cluster assembly factor [Leuconostoc mesenteroides]MDN6491114.1 metal-sulfur cluster assembly factor [Leuconostoc sp.]AKP36064.1 DNA methyltransferase [Leuconostoc mesenteroides subsp. dextranicum]MBZ1510584.1 metal-sulfur cluster assembly factor [Leuconostoc mesenteroides]MBZ1525036.1 metal-sulfur cluster assembly factor [Leuconostoc mesenteroides]ORI94466.1 DNA methyltransferase [Leuconostoc mesenteroides subsp. mesenteroides]